MSDRFITVEENEKATIMVRTKHHVSLVFATFTMDVFQREGCIFTRQYVHGDDGSETEDDNESPYLEGQPFDYKDKFTTPVEPVVVTRNAGGTFEQVNEKHAQHIETQELDEVKSCLDLTPGYLDSGETQLNESPDLIN